MRVIIFDFDGVIHDTFDLAYNIHKKVYPGTSLDDYRALLDGNVFEKVDIDSKSQEKYRELEFEAFRGLKLEKEIRKELEELSKKFDLFIISSNSIRNLNKYFENSNFIHVFKEILTAETHASKVKKFKILFEKYGLDSASCVFVTDTLGDILEANKVGVKTIGVDFGYHKRERLEKGMPFKIVSKFEDIRKVVEGM